MTKRWAVVAASLTAAASTQLVGAPARAAGLPYIVAGPMAQATSYLTRNVTITHGSSLSFLDLDAIPHSVTSRETYVKTTKIGKHTFRTHVPYFNTTLVKGPVNVAINGIASLKPGTYHFYCTIHENMTGTLTVK